MVKNKKTAFPLRAGTLGKAVRINEIKYIPNTPNRQELSLSNLVKVEISGKASEQCRPEKAQMQVVILRRSLLSTEGVDMPETRKADSPSQMNGTLGNFAEVQVLSCCNLSNLMIASFYGSTTVLGNGLEVIL